MPLSKKVKVILAVTLAAIVAAMGTLACSSPKSAYDIATEKLDSQTSQYFKGVELNPNSEKAIGELAFLPKEGRLVLAEDIRSYTSDGVISANELPDLTDSDLDGIIHSNDPNPMDPSNSTQEISPNTFSFVRDLVKYNKSQGNGNTLPETYSGLEKVIEVVESNPEIIKDFSPLQNHVLASLVSHVPEITKYPKAMRQGTIQVVSQNLADDNAMGKFAAPAIEYIVRLQDEGKINALNGFGLPEEYADLEAQGIRQILLPYELREVNITTGVRMAASLETGIYNVTFDESLGKSPQEWLRDIAVRDYEDKDLIVWNWINEYPAEYGPRGPWSNSAKVYAEYLKSVDDLVLFIRDYPIYLMNEQSGKLIPELTGQTAPYYSVLVGGLLDKALFDVKAIYPTTQNPDRPGIHSEPFILMNETSDDWLLPHLFGFWTEKQAFIDDYKDKPFSTPHAEVRRANGTYELINSTQ